MRPIDAHAHIFVNSPEVRRLFDEMDFRFVNITCVDPYDRGYETVEPQLREAFDVFRGSGGRAPWVSTFDAKDWESPGFAGRVITELEKTFKQGAVGVKMYKTIGMELRSKSGAFVLPDNPAFAPVLEAVARHNKTLYAHIAEPIGAWKPLDPKDPDYDYYKNNSSWHMYGHPERPSKAAILAARDRMLGQHPGLRVVGCHLGSMEEDVDEVAKRLDRYPNFAVDTAARVRHLAFQPREKVRAFLLKYQDRVLYGTDRGIIPGNDAAAGVREWKAELDKDWKYFATSETVDYLGHKVKGLELPEPVLRKLYHDNAVKWVPGIIAAK
jgi:predicted TIM-barrel fold metal-dependent hydrolase